MSISFSGTRNPVMPSKVCRGLVTKEENGSVRQLDAYANNGGYASHGHAICAFRKRILRICTETVYAEIDCWTVIFLTDSLVLCVWMVVSTGSMVL